MIVDLYESDKKNKELSDLLNISNAKLKKTELNKIEVENFFIKKVMKISDDKSEKIEKCIKDKDALYKREIGMLEKKNKELQSEQDKMNEKLRVYNKKICELSALQENHLKEIDELKKKNEELEKNLKKLQKNN